MPKRAREGALTEVLQALGRHLRELRVSSGFTQERAAQAVGVSAQAVRNWEAGRHEPNAERLKRLAALYGVTMEELLGRTPGTTSDEAAATGVQVRGYLTGGADPQQDSVEIGPMPLREFVLPDQSRTFALVVNGDFLSAHGIQDGDLIVIDPDGELAESCVHTRMDELVLAGATQASIGRVAQFSGSRRAVVSPEASEQVLSRVVWHLRRM